MVSWSAMATQPEDGHAKSAPAAGDDGADRSRVSRVGPVRARCVLRYRAEPRLTNLVRRFIVSLATKVLHDDDLADRLGVAIHELLENARYATDSMTDVSIHLGEQELTVRMDNHASEKHRARLLAIVEERTAAPDPDEGYRNRRRHSATLTDESGLGLARIMAEAGMTLDVSVDGDRVTLLAKLPVPGGEYD